MIAGAPSYRYLNRDNVWPEFRYHGLSLDMDGVLHLAALPRLEGDPPPALAGLPAPAGPAGIAVTPDGAVFFSDLACHRILRLDNCGGRDPATCVGGLGDDPGRLHQPRGLAYHPFRHALLVADSANHRVQLFDVVTLQLVDVWGRRGVREGEFLSPWGVAPDAVGNTYVVDYGNQRVQKLDSFGHAVPRFWKQVRVQANKHGFVLNRPVDVAVWTGPSGAEVLILDAEARTVFVFSATGHYRRSIELPQPDLAASDPPMGLAVTGDVVYIGDNSRRRVLTFTPDGTFVGEAAGYAGPVAALTLDGQGGLWVHSGADPDGEPGGIGGVTGGCSAQVGLSQAPAWNGLLRLAARGGHTRRGFMWGGGFTNPSAHAEQWHWLRAMVEPLPARAHFQLYVFRGAPGERPVAPPAASEPPWELTGTTVMELGECLATLAGPPPGALAPIGRADAGRGAWVRIPPDAPECLIPGQLGDELWIGAEFAGDGLVSPALTQMRLDFDHPTWLRHLPPLYQEDRRSRLFLGRFLTLFEGLYDDVETEIRGLPADFDPDAVPAEWLDWLGGWLALDMPEDWDAARKRAAIRQVFDAYARRGTPEGVRAMVRLLCNIDVRIEEPIQHAGWWALPPQDGATPLELDQSQLGFTTMLAAVEPQGAVLGSSALLDGVHLIAGDAYGASLFDEVAYRFSVLMYRGAGYSEAKRDEVRGVIDRERPAHTAYHLCLVEPRLRVGYQARIGVDSVIAAPPSPTRLSTGDAEGGLVLGGDPPARIGEDSRIGQTTRLGD
jgi:phage tail-like protein